MLAEAPAGAALEVQAGPSQLAGPKAAFRRGTVRSKERAQSTLSGVLLHFCHQLFEALAITELCGLLDADRNTIATDLRVVS